MSAEDNKALVAYLIEAGLNANNPDVADGRFTDDYVAHIPGVPPSATRGPEVFKAVIRLWRGAFSDWHMTVEQLVAEGEFVANRFTTTGTHDRPLFGISPTGKRIEVHSQELHRVLGGKVAESFIVDDVPGILVQLGVIQMPRPAGVR